MTLASTKAIRAVAWRLAIGIALATLFAIAIGSIDNRARARGFDWFFEHVPPSGQCPGREIAVSYYNRGRRTATGEAFDANGNTAASRTLAFGTHVTITNPQTRRSVTVRINDRGPFGCGRMSCAARERAGLKTLHLDLARGAARRIGMKQTIWACTE